MRKLFGVLGVFLIVSAFGWAQSPNFTGDGGRGIRITVAEPTGRGLTAQEQALLPLIQSTIIGVFHGFSAMTVFDRQNLENTLAEQRRSMSGEFSDTDYIRIGHLTNARYIVFGSITKIANNYNLELAVTDVENGERKASYPPRQVSFLALENFSAVREASAELLRQLGINLTAQGSQELRRTPDTSRVQSENLLARGIAAQRQGTVVEALSYYIQSANVDPRLAEAASRMNIMNANISSGNIGMDARNDIA